MVFPIGYWESRDCQTWMGEYPWPSGSDLPFPWHVAILSGMRMKAKEKAKGSKQKSTKEKVDL